MLMTFCAMTTAVAVLTHRSLLQRLLLVASALPLAVVCNVARITLTGAVQEIFGQGQASHLVFHDVAGWLMIAMGLVLLGLELAILNRLFVPADTPGPALARPPAQPAGAADPAGVQLPTALRMTARAGR
jgi:exosortase/archaeosortase family protein